MIFAPARVLCFRCKKPIINREATRGIFSCYGSDGRLVGTARTAACCSPDDGGPCAAGHCRPYGNQPGTDPPDYRNGHHSGDNQATGHGR